MGTICIGNFLSCTGTAWPLPWLFPTFPWLFVDERHISSSTSHGRMRGCQALILRAAQKANAQRSDERPSYRVFRSVEQRIYECSMQMTRRQQGWNTKESRSRLTNGSEGVRYLCSYLILAYIFVGLSLICCQTNHIQVLVQPPCPKSPIIASLLFASHSNWLWGYLRPTITMLGLETTRKSPAVDKEIPSFDSGRAGDLYPFKCLVQSAVRRARIDIKHRTCYLLLYMFSPVFIKSGWFSRCFPHLLLPYFFDHLPRYKLVQKGHCN